MNRALLLTAALAAAAGCSAILDFDDEADLPCECRTGFVCLRASNRCVPTRSVELFKSCSLDADSPDDLCPENAICYNLKGRGPRCLPLCTPTTYSTPEAGLKVNAQCPVGKTCWEAGTRGGVCDEGECTDVPNNCPPTQRCVAFNGAGVCFTECQIFQGDACVDQTRACHPIGASSVTACVPIGTAGYSDLCSDTMPCAKFDAANRPMVCDREANSQAPRRCWPVCVPGDGRQCSAQETCQFARSRINEVSGVDLGLCIPR